MSKARTLAGTVSDGAVLADGTVGYAEVSGAPTAPTGTIVGTTDTQTLTNKTLQAPNITNGLTMAGAAGTAGQVLTSAGAGAAPTWATVSAGFTLGTPVSMGAEPLNIDYTGIPAGVRTIIVSFARIRTNGTQRFGVVLGDAGGFEVDAYTNSSIALFNGINTQVASATEGFYERQISDNRADRTGSIVLTLLNNTTNRWVANGAFRVSDGAFSNPLSMFIHGEKSLSQQLTQLRITASGDRFIAGEVNIMYI
jgi:hypothetical protein